MFILYVLFPPVDHLFPLLRVKSYLFEILSLSMHDDFDVHRQLSDDFSWEKRSNLFFERVNTEQYTKVEKKKKHLFI